LLTHALVDCVDPSGGNLPWQDLMHRSSRRMGRAKRECPIETLCTFGRPDPTGRAEPLPPAFTALLLYARGLGFEEAPDYELMVSIMRDAASHR
jgi:hypothetical protein